MVAAFPLAKLGFLMIKQISKPIANTLAKRARSSRIFREYVCIPTAQLFHWYDVKIRMSILRLGNVSKVPKLDEKRAIETGSQLLSEFILFSVGAGILIVEYQRSAAKEEAKQQQAADEREELQQKVTSMELTLEKQRTQILQLSRLTFHLEGEIQKKSLKGLFGGKPAHPPELEELEKENEAKKEEFEKEVKKETDSNKEVKKGTDSNKKDTKDVSFESRNGVVYSAVDLVLGPETPSEVTKSYQPGQVTSAVNFYLNGCREI